MSKGLETAITWQNNLENVELTHNNVAYDNPHTWIIAIIGSDHATILNHGRLKSLNKRKSAHIDIKVEKEKKGTLTAKADLAKTDIHIVGMSPSHMTKTRVHDYRKVCDET